MALGEGVAEFLDAGLRHPAGVAHGGSRGWPRSTTSPRCRPPTTSLLLDASPARFFNSGGGRPRWSPRSTRPTRTVTRSAAWSRWVVNGLPPGLGSHVHWDRRLDSRLAAALMGIQAIKGVEVGDGFRAQRRRGSSGARRDGAVGTTSSRRRPAVRAAPKAGCRRAGCCGSARR